MVLCSWAGRMCSCELAFNGSWKGLYCQSGLPFTNFPRVFGKPVRNAVWEPDRLLVLHPTCFLMESIPKRGVPSLTLMNTPLQKGALITSDTPYTVLKIWVVIWALPWNGTVRESGIWRLLLHHPSSLLTKVKFWTWGLIMNFSCWVRKQPSRYQLLSITLLAEQRAKFSLGSFTKVLDVCRFLGYFIWLVWCLTHSLRSVAATPAPTSCSKKGLNWKKEKKI